MIQRRLQFSLLWRSLDMADYLYHYTNIETIALILSNRTIRFNPLDKMDDLQEKEAEDIINAGQYVFISSWTEDETESIPMWKMYSSLTSGVRIKLKKCPFKQYDLKREYLEHVGRTIGSPLRGYESGNKKLTAIIPLEDMFKRKYATHPLIQQEEILKKVEYTNDKSKLYPHVIKQDDNGTVFRFDQLGRYKNSHWSFQKEWRYILWFLPFDILDFNKTEENLSIMTMNLISGTGEAPFRFFDLTIDDDAFKDMEITMSPRISAGNRVILRNLVEVYNSSASIKESSLCGLI